VTDKHSSNDRPKFTLKGEMQKRRTKEILRTIEDKRTGVARSMTANGSDPSRVTQTVPVAPPSASDPKPATLQPAVTTTRETTASYENRRTKQQRAELPG